MWWRLASLQCVAVCWICFLWGQTRRYALIFLMMKSTALKFLILKRNARCRRFLKFACCQPTSFPLMKKPFIHFVKNGVKCLTAIPLRLCRIGKCRTVFLVVVRNIICRCFLMKNVCRFLIILLIIQK